LLVGSDVHVPENADFVGCKEEAERNPPIIGVPPEPRLSKLHDHLRR
jgi:hypothetical protein